MEEKETKAQRVERLKKEKDGLDVIEDIRALAKSGEHAPADTVDRLKWYGMYTHNELASPDNNQYFMIRSKVPNGKLSTQQLDVMASISNDFAKGSADATVRQTIQFHWLEMKNIPAMLERLESVGLTAQNASGDCPRSIVGCPLQGITHDEYVDVTEVRNQVNAFFQGNYDFSNLPRKYKIGISACKKHCMGHEIQDLAFTAFETEGKVRFDVTIGGGLGSNKRVGSRLGSVALEQIFHVCVAVGKLFRDHGNRDNRRKARVGHLVEDWGVEKIRSFLEETQGFAFEKTDEPHFTPYKDREHFGVQRSNQEGYVHLGCATMSGRLQGKSLEKLSLTCKQNGAEGIILTTGQNFIITNIPLAALDKIKKDVEAAGFAWNPSPFRARSLACTGLEYCKFAVSETKDKETELVEYLEKRFPDFNEPIAISLSGCPNACSHPHIVDLGFIGCKMKEDGETTTGFTLVTGGHIEGESKSRFAQKTSIKVSSAKLCEFVGSLIESYQNDPAYNSFKAYIQTKEL